MNLLIPISSLLKFDVKIVFDFHFIGGAKLNRLILLFVVLMVFQPSYASSEPPKGLTAADIDKIMAHNDSSTADHSKFKELQGPFTTGPEVTQACLACHTEASKQLHHTKHWKWEYENPETGQLLGKKHEMNVFCGSLLSNYERCTSCHIGYGWEDNNFDFSAEENVDCLVCHDTTTLYVKPSADAGHPAYQDKMKKGKVVIENNKAIKKVDLAHVAQNVGKTSRFTCGNCHFYGGGADGVKHGDLDSSLNAPKHSLDVHMDVDGLNFSCATCHTSDNHEVAGSRYLVNAKDDQGIDVPGKDDGRASCESCHGLAPHPDSVNNKLNDHVDKIACQTCHIPEFARGGVATKTVWEWSEATKKMNRDAEGNLILGANGKPTKLIERDEHGHASYMSHKGRFEHGENVVPEYHWFDGEIEFNLMNEPFDPSERLSVNRIKGSYDDEDSRIWPFKRMIGSQPYDKKSNTLLASKVYGPKTDTALWTNFDWAKALEAGQSEAVAVGESKYPFSGEFGFVKNEMYWPITHMVAPTEEALACDDCHAKEGRLANLSGFYMPGRDNFGWLDTIGLYLIYLALAAVLLHGLGRLIFRSK